jgi:hypothetical protein
MINTNFLIILSEQLNQGRYGEAYHTRNRIAELTRVRLVDRGPIRGLEVDRSDELPEGIVPLAGRPLNDAMDRIGRRVMLAEFGDNGRPTGSEQVGESGVDSDSSYGRLPGRVIESDLNEKPPSGPGKPTGGLNRSAAGRTADRACSRGPNAEAPTHGDRTL